MSLSWSLKRMSQSQLKVLGVGEERASLQRRMTGLRDLIVLLKTEVKGKSSLLGKVRGKGKGKTLL